MQLLDRSGRPRVSGLVRRRLATLAVTAALGAWIPACHGGKHASTTPAAGGGRAAPAENMQSSSGATGSSEGGAGAGAAGGAQGGAAQAGGPAGGSSKPNQPKIAPPGLDLPPAVVKARVQGHLRKAQAALDGRHKHPNVAIDEAKAALAVDETSVPAMLDLAYANYVKGYYDQAQAVLDIAAKHRAGKTSAKLEFLYGLIYQKQGHKDKAMAAYASAVQRDPNYRSALLNLGVFYLKNKRYSEAIRLYERLTGQLRLDTAVAWNDLGSAYRGRAGEFAGTSGDVNQRNAYLEKAIAAYERAIKLNPGYADAYYNLGILYLDGDSLPGRGGAKMDTLKRLQAAKQYLDRYRRMPGANVKLADKQASVISDLYNREKKLRALRKRRQQFQKMNQHGRGG